MEFSSELVPVSFRALWLAENKLISFQIKVNLYAPPTYFMTTLTNDKKVGFDTLNLAMGKLSYEKEKFNVDNRET